MTIELQLYSNYHFSRASYTFDGNRYYLFFIGYIAVCFIFSRLHFLRISFTDYRSSGLAFEQHEWENDLRATARMLNNQLVIPHKSFVCHICKAARRQRRQYSWRKLLWKLTGAA